MLKENRKKKFVLYSVAIAIIGVFTFQDVKGAVTKTAKNKDDLETTVQKWQNFGNPRIITSADKNWTIKLNQKIEVASASTKNVYIGTNKNGENAVRNVLVKMSADGTSILINYDNKVLWREGKTYYLFITNRIKTIDGKYLKIPLRMKFILRK